MQARTDSTRVAALRENGAKGSNLNSLQRLVEPAWVSDGSPGLKVFTRSLSETNCSARRTDGGGCSRAPARQGRVFWGGGGGVVFTAPRNAYAYGLTLRSFRFPPPSLHHFSPTRVSRFTTSSLPSAICGTQARMLRRKYGQAGLR